MKKQKIGYPMLTVAALCGWPILCLAACGETPPCMEGVRLGQTYDVKVLEPYDEKSAFSFDESFFISESQRCGDFDLKGISFRVTPRENLSNVVCHGRAATVSDVPELQITGTAQEVQDGSRGLMSSPTYIGLLKGNCKTTWTIEFDGPDRKADPLATPMAGKLPPVTMSRQLEPDPETLDACRAVGFPTDRARCADYFVVHLTPAGG